MLDKSKRGNVGGKDVVLIVRTTSLGPVRRAIADFNRNGTPFRAEAETTNSAKTEEQLAKEALEMLKKRIKKAYEGSNVDTQALLKFLNIRL